MTDTLNLQVLPEPPKEFIRGQSLEFLMELPPTVPAGFFMSASVSTVLSSQLRKAEDASASGLISPLTVTWEDPPSYTTLRFKNPDTSDTALWPLGLAEFDVLFEKTTEGEGGSVTKEFRSLPVRFKIVDGITR